MALIERKKTNVIVSPATGETNLLLVHDREAEELEHEIDVQIEWNRLRTNEWEWRYAKLAKDLATYDREQMWRRRGFSSLRAFIEWECKKFDLSPSALWNVVWVGQRIVPYLDSETMRQLGKSKLQLMASYVGASGAPPPSGLIEAAKTMHVAQFEAAVRGRQPLLVGESIRDLDLVKVGPFFITRTERQHYSRVMELGRKLEGVQSPSRLFVMILDHALAAWLADEAAEERVITESQKGEQVENG